MYLQLFYSAKGKRIKFTDVTVEGQDTKKDLDETMKQYTALVLQSL